jgi:hypothetical protein
VLLLAAPESLIGDKLVVPLGGIAAILAMLGMLMLLPLFVTQRREIARLRDWHDREPEAGDQGPRPVQAATLRSTGPMSAAERVTSERPALARIGTAERAAIELEQAPFWRRVVIRGPRHPLVLSLGALALAAAAIIVVGLVLRADSEKGGGSGVDHADVDVVVLNASSSSGLAGDIGDDVAKSDFNVTGVNVAQDNLQKSVVQYADGAKAEARAVARSLGITIGGPFDPYSEAKAAGADVVVIAGEDLAKAPNGKD